MSYGFEADEDNGMGMGTVEVPYDDVLDAMEMAGGVETDDVWDAEIDHAEEDRIAKRAMAPAGYYEVAKLEGGDIKEREVEYYEEADNGLRLVRKPRKRVSYYGMGQKEHDGRVVTTRLRFSICPTPGYGKDYQTGEPSTQKLSNDFKLYQACKKAYEQVLGEKPKSPRQVLDYLSRYPVKLRTMQGNDGLVVLDVVGVKV